MKNHENQIIHNNWNQNFLMYVLETDQFWLTFK
jgi:hypothetical protein